MKNEQILERTLQVFRECEIFSFPFNCIEPFSHYGYKVFSYGELRSKSKELYDFCMEYSEDSFRDGNSKIVAYNDSEVNRKRVRFSLMHELGHIVLNHYGGSEHNEQEANYFASNILAPRMAIHYAHCMNHAEVSEVFHISLEAADYAFQDYRRWRRLAVYHMSALDWEMYRHFWNKNCKKFVYSMTYCYDCDELLYNQPNVHRCPKCEYRHRMTHIRNCKDIFDEEYDDTKSIWYH